MPETNETTGNGAATTERGTTTTGDAELTALAKITRLLGGLTDAERSRIVRYLAEKYESDLA